MIALHKKSNSKRGFTIVELVTVIAVLAILIGILVPTFSGMLEDSKQRALRMELETAYTAFAADCGFRDEPVKNIDQYIFVEEDAISFTAAATKITDVGYRWDGGSETDVESVNADSIDTSASTAVYGPFQGYYLLGSGMAIVWTGAGSAADPFRISSYQELRSIAERVARGETFSGKYFRLERELSISDSFWLPIGGFLSPTQPDTANSRVFSGTFDGNGYTISLSYGRVKLDGYCLFGYVSNATIKNLQVAGSIDIGANAGGIAAKANNTTFQNCASSMDVAGDHHVGGIVGHATGSTKILGCMNRGSVSAFSVSDNGINSAVGGIVGEAASGVSIEDSCNQGTVLGTGGTVGGIAGIVAGNVKFCINHGNVTAHGFAAQPVSGGNATESLAGGIVGWGTGTAKIDSCGNTGDVYAEYRAAGGIAGADAIIVNAANIGEVSGTGDIGGIMGIVTNVNCTVTNALNAGRVNCKGEYASGTFSGPTGGIVGRVTSTSQYTITLAANSGEIWYRKGASNTDYSAVGVMVGSAGGKVSLQNTFITQKNCVYIGVHSPSTSIVGACSNTPTAPTYIDNPGTLADAINGLPGTHRAWTSELGFFDELPVPLVTNSVVYVAGDAQRVRMDTSFIGASNVYIPYPSITSFSEYDSQTEQELTYTFSGWTELTLNTLQAPGDRFTLTSDSNFSSKWQGTYKPIGPVPFE